MSNILFIYNDLNDIKGISTVMQVAERYALNSDKGRFWVNSRPSPSIKFEEGTVISIKPVTSGLLYFDSYDEVYIDDSITTFMETEGIIRDHVSFYNKTSFQK